MSTQYKQIFLYKNNQVPLICFLCYMLFLQTPHFQETILSSDKRLYFKTPVKYTKDQDLPFKLVISSTGVFTLRFYVKMDPKTLPEIDELLSIIKRKQSQTRYRLFLNYRDFASPPDPGSHVFNEIQHGAPLLLDMTEWTLVSVRFTCWESGSLLYFKAEVFTNDQGFPQTSANGQYSDVNLPADFVLTIGHFDPESKYVSR